jgi:predicted deacylase
MIERTIIEYPHELLHGLEHPAFVAHGDAGDGPKLSLIGGIHGCEYSSIAAVTRFMNELNTAELKGTITAVPVVSMESFRQRSPFVVPVDGKNLNRCFPGRFDGTYTDVLARSIYETLIEPADVLLDLHGGDQVEALEPFTTYDASPLEDRAHEVAAAFNFPYVIRSEREEGELSGLTTSAAVLAGIPGVIAEAGGRGLLEEQSTTMLVDGVRNALRVLGMLPGPPESPPATQRQVASFIWLRSQHEGWWDWAVEAGEEVSAGQVLGRIRDLWGDVREEIAAPQDGAVLFITSSPATVANGLLLGLGAGFTAASARR